jgi:hypothetical protein
MMICRRGKDAAGAVQRARYLSVYAPLILTPKSHVTLLEESLTSGEDRGVIARRM